MPTKITELTDLGAKPDDADIFVLVDDPAGSPVTKKVTFSDLLDDAVRDGDMAGTYAGHMHRLSGTTYEVIKSNLAGTTAPTSTDDSNSDYSVGSMWIDTTNDKVYFCYDASAGSALWQEVGAGGGPAAMSMLLSPEAARIPSSGGAIKTQVEGTNVSYTVVDFDDTTDQSVFWQFIMPQSYDGGNFTLNLHSFASATSGSALMDVEACVVEAGEVVDQALTSLGTITVAPDATTNELVVDTDATNSLTGLAGGDMVILKLTRDADNASDTMTGDLRVTGLELEYTPA